MQKVTGINANIEYTDRRLGDSARLLLSLAIYEELGWEAKINMDKIIESAWKWHKGKRK